MKKMEEITFYRNKRGDKIQRVDRVDEIEIIKKEMPYWADFFKSREE